MSYIVLARKYRPMSFDDLAGQDHIAQTLSNAIATDRVAHAFLFTGVRGVGKTSSARILAKALNCMGKPGTVEAGTDPGPTVSPCLECPACREIAVGSDMDVQEIDGASYNGVDEVRRLQDSLPYRPQRDRFKIVIVDEVHMLSQSAWNAFLKTLEEPPPHVKFIFATTEAHKVPITILSRVQRFDFKLIPTRTIIDRLRLVLGQEGIEADDNALSIISREAAGSMRDALSLLDQVIAWGGQRLEGETVAQVLGVASRRVLHDLARRIAVGDPSGCLRIVDELAGQGYDMVHVSRDLLALLRDLVVAKVCADPGNLLDLPDEERSDAIALAAATEVNDLVRLHQGFSQGFDAVARNSQPRAALEMLLVRLALRPPLLPLDELLTRIAALERRLGGPPSNPGHTGPASAGGGGGAGKPAPSPGPGRRAGARPPAHQRSAPASAPPGRPLAPQPPPDLSSKPNLTPDERPPSSVPPLAADAPPPPAPSTPHDPDLDQVSPDWRAIVDRVRTQRPEIGAFLSHAVPIRCDREQITLGWERDSLFADPASGKEERLLLLQAARDHFGVEPSIQFERDHERDGTDTVAVVESREREAALKAALNEARQHPTVIAATQILGARVKDVRLPEG